MYVFKFFDSKILSKLAGLSPEEALSLYESSGMHAPAIKYRLLDAIEGKIDNYYFEVKTETLKNTTQEPVKKGQDLTTKEKLVLSKSDYLSDKDISIMFPKVQSTFQKSIKPGYILKNNILDFSDDSKNTIDISSIAEEARKASIFKNLTDNNPLLISCSPEYLTSCKEELSKFISYNNIDKIHVAQSLIANCVYFYDLEFRIPDSPKYLVTNRSPQKDLIIPKYSQENPRPLSSDEFCISMIKKYRFNSDWKGELLKPSLKYVHRSIEIGEEYDSRHCSYDETSGVGSDCPFRSVFSHIYQMSYLNRINFSYLRNFFKFPIGTILVVEFVEYLCMKLGLSLLLVSNMTTTISFVSEEFAFIHHASAHYSRMNSTNQKPQYSSAIFRNISENYVPLMFLRKNNPHVDKLKPSLILIKNSTWKLKAYKKEPETLKMYRVVIDYISPFISEIKKLETSSTLRENLFSVQSFGTQYWDITTCKNSFIHFRWVNLMRQLVSDLTRKNIIFLDSLTDPDLNERMSDNIPDPPVFESSRKMRSYRKSIDPDEFLLFNVKFRIKQLKMRIGTLFDRDPDKTLQTIRVLEHNIYLTVLSNCFSLINTGAYNKKLEDSYLNRFPRLFMSTEEIQNLVNVTSHFVSQFEDVDRSNIFMGYVKKTQIKKAEYPSISLLQHHRLLYRKVLIELIVRALDKYNHQTKPYSTIDLSQERDSEVIMKEADILDKHPSEEFSYDIPEGLFLEFTPVPVEPNVVEPNIEIKTPSVLKQESEELSISVELNKNISQLSDEKFVNQKFRESMDILCSKNMKMSSKLSSMEDKFCEIEKSDECKRSSNVCIRWLKRFVKAFENEISERPDSATSDEVLKFITGSILKLRVAIISNSVMDIFDRADTTDIKFSVYFPSLSRRTPDYIFKDESKMECMILETSYSSKRAKGIIAKGYSIQTSKYYEEIYCIQEMGYKVIYLPMIFYDKMPLNEELFINYNENDHNSTNQEKLFFNCFKKLKETFSETFSLDKLRKFIYNMEISFKINDLIYPAGRLLNKALTDILSRRLPIQADFYKYSYIVEYNYYLLISIEPRFSRFPKAVIDHIFKKRFSNLDQISLTILKDQFHHASRLAYKIQFTAMDEFSDSGFKFSRIVNMFSPQFFNTEESVNLDFARYCNMEEIKKVYEHYCRVSAIDSRSMEFTNFIKIKPETEYTNFDMRSGSGFPAQDIPLRFWREFFNENRKKNKNSSMSAPVTTHQNVADQLHPDISDQFKTSKMPSSVDISELIKMKREKRRSLSRSLSSLPLSSLIQYLRSKTENQGKKIIIKLTKNVLFIDYNSNVNLFSLFKNYPGIAKLYCSGFNFRILDDPGYLDMSTVQSMIQSTDVINDESMMCFKNYILFKNFYVSEPKNLRITGSELHNAVKFTRESEDPTLIVEPLSYEDLINHKMKFANINYFSSVNSNEDKEKWKELTAAIKDYPIDETKEESYMRYVKSVESIEDNFTVDTVEIDSGSLLTHINSHGMKDHRKLTGVSIGYNFDIENFKERCFKTEDKNKLLNEIIEKSHKKEKRLGPFTLKAGLLYKRSLLEKDGFLLLDISKERDKLLNELANRFSDLKDETVFSKTYKRNLISYSQTKKSAQERLEKKLYTKNMDHDKCIRFESLEDIDQYGEYLNQLSKSSSASDYEFLSITEQLYSVCKDESLKIGDEVLSAVLSNDTIRSFYEESMLSLSLSMKTQFKHSRSFFSLIEEGFKNRVAILFPHDGGNRIRYSFVTYGKLDIRSKYKNSDRSVASGGSKQFLMTNMITDTAETLFFKYQLFFTLLQQSIILYNRGINVKSLKKFFIMNYELLSSMGKNTKMMLSIFKYLNVIQFTDFSRVKDLFKKYIMSNIYVSEVQSYFAKSIIDNFNFNFSILEPIRKDDNGQLTNVRNLTSKIKIKLYSMCGEVDNFQTFVMCNSFYSYVFKDTTQLGINYVNFYKTVINNNQETRKFKSLFSPNENHRTNEKKIYDNLLSERPCFYDENIMYHSMEMMHKNLSKMYGDKFSGEILSKNIIENFKEDIIDEFSQSFLSARRSLYFDIKKLTLKESNKNSEKKKERKLRKGKLKLFEESKGFDALRTKDASQIHKIKKVLNIKQTVMRSTLDFMSYMRDKYDSEKEFDPIEVFNSLIEIITNQTAYSDLISYFNLSINSKKAQYEDDREIYIIHITMKMMLFYVQSVFKTINLLIPSEMVVRSVGQKLHEIKEMSQISLSSSYLDTETVFANGDMAAWSGTDIEEKFRFLSIMLVKSWGIDPKISSLLTLVLECCKEMKIIINPSISEHVLNPDILIPLKENPDVKYIYLMDSWGQGLYHNISSFVHTLELIWRKNCLLTRTLEICDQEFEEQNSKYEGESHGNNRSSKKGIALNPDEIIYVEELKEYINRFKLISRIRNHEFPNSLASKYYPYEELITDFAKSVFLKLGISGYESTSFLKKNFKSLNLKEFDQDELVRLKISFSDPYRFSKLKKADSWSEIPRYSSFEYFSESVTEKTSEFKFVSNEKRNLFNYLLKKISQISHSDDKNEIYNIQLKIYSLIIKYSDYGTLYFSLKTSKTKNSFSRFVSEMVGLQNIQGFLFDNPIKVISGAMTNISEPDFINNNKALLSRYLDYYRKSSDEISSTIMYRLGYSLLIIRYGLRDYISSKTEFQKLLLLPIDFGGMYIGRFRSLAHYGSYSDLVTKDIIYSKLGGYIFSQLYENKKTLKRFLMKNTYESLSRFYTDYTGKEISSSSIEIMSVNSRLSSSEFIKNIAENAIKTRKEMFVNHGLRYNLTNLLHYKKNKYKIREMKDVAIMDIYTYLKTSISYFMPKFTKQENIDQFCVDPEIIPRIIKEESFSIDVNQNRNLILEGPFFDCRGFNIRSVKNEFQIGSLSYLTVKDLSMRKFSKVFNDYRNSKNMEKILSTYNKILRAFNIHSLDDVSNKRGEIERWNDYMINKKDHIFVNFDSDSKDLNYMTSDIDLGEKSSFLLVDKMNWKLMIMDKSRFFASLFDKFKSTMNKYLIDYNIEYLQRIEEEVFSGLIDDQMVKDFIRYTKDDNVKHFWKYWNQSSSSMPVEIDPTAPPPYKFRFLMKSENFVIYLIKSSKIIVDILITFKNESFFCCKISFNNLNHFQFKHLKAISDSSVSEVVEALNFIKEAGLSIRYDTSSLRLKDIRRTMLISPTFNVIRNNPIKKGRVFVTSVEGSYYYSFKPYVEYMDLFIEVKAFLLKTSTKVKFTPVTDKNLQIPNRVVTFRRPVKYSRFDIMKMSKEFIAFCKLHSHDLEFITFLTSLKIITFNDKALLSTRQPYLFLHQIPNIPESQNFTYKRLKTKFEDTRDLDSMTLIKFILDPKSVFIEETLLSKFYPLKLVDNSQKNDMMLELSDGYDPVTFMSICFTIWCAFSDPDSPGNRAFPLNHKKVLISFYNTMMAIIMNSENFLNCDYHAFDATMLNDLVRFITTGGQVRSYQNQVIQHAVKYISVLSEQYRVEQTGFNFDYEDEYFLREDLKFFLNPTEDVIDQLNSELSHKSTENIVLSNSKSMLEREIIMQRKNLEDTLVAKVNLESETKVLKESLSKSEENINDMQLKLNKTLNVVKDLNKEKIEVKKVQKEKKNILKEKVVDLKKSNENLNADLSILNEELEKTKQIDYHESCRERENELLEIIKQLRTEISAIQAKMGNNSKLTDSVKKLLTMKTELIVDLENRILELEGQEDVGTNLKEELEEERKKQEETNKIVSALRNSIIIDNGDYVAEIQVPYKSKTIVKKKFGELSPKSCIPEVSYFARVKNTDIKYKKIDIIRTEFLDKSPKSSVVSIRKIPKKKDEEKQVISHYSENQVSTITFNTVLAHVPEFIIEKFENLVKEIYSDNNHFAKKKPSGVMFNIALMIVKNTDSLSHLRSFQNLRNDISLLMMISCGLDISLYEKLVEETDKISNGNVTMFWTIIYFYTEVASIGKFLAGAMTAENERICRSYYKIRRDELDEYVTRMSKKDYKVSYLIESNMDDTIAKVDKIGEDLNWISIRHTDNYEFLEVAVDFRLHTVGKMAFFGVKYNAEGFETKGRFNFAGRCYMSNVDVVNPEFINQVLDRRDNMLMPVSIRKIVTKPKDYKSSLTFPIRSDESGRIVIVRRLFVEIDGLSYKKDYIVDESKKLKPSEIKEKNSENVALIKSFIDLKYKVSYCQRRKLRILSLNILYIEKEISGFKPENDLEMSDIGELRKTIKLGSIYEFLDSLRTVKVYSVRCSNLVIKLAKESDETYDGRFCLIASDNLQIEDIDKFVIKDQLDSFRLMTAHLRNNSVLTKKIDEMKSDEIYGEVMCVRMPIKKLWLGIDLRNKNKIGEIKATEKTPVKDVMVFKGGRSKEGMMLKGKTLDEINSFVSANKSFDYFYALKKAVESLNSDYWEIKKIETKESKEKEEQTSSRPVDVPKHTPVNPKPEASAIKPAKEDLLKFSASPPVDLDKTKLLIGRNKKDLTSEENNRLTEYEKYLRMKRLEGIDIPKNEIKSTDFVGKTVTQFFSYFGMDVDSVIVGSVVTPWKVSVGLTDKKLPWKNKIVTEKCVMIIMEEMFRLTHGLNKIDIGFLKHGNQFYWKKL